MGGSSTYDPSTYQAAIDMERLDIQQEVADESFKMNERALEAREKSMEFLDEGHGLLSDYLDIRLDNMRETNQFYAGILDEDIPELQEYARTGARELTDSLLSTMNQYRDVLERGEFSGF